MLAAFVTKGASRRLEFYFDQADWALFTGIFGSAWLNWASNGVIGGLRRIELNPQVDDIFMATGEFDPSTWAENLGNPFRLSPNDVTVGFVGFLFSKLFANHIAEY